MVLRLTSLLIWASLSIDGASGYSNIEYSKALEGLKREVPGGGWNGIGRGFLNMFTPNKLTDEHWQIIGKMNKNFEGSLITELASSMGGVVFLVVVSILLILLFCSAPVSYGVFLFKWKKKYKPKSNAIVAYSGLACSSVAILTISISILFCALSIVSLQRGIASSEDSIEYLPKVIVSFADTLKNEIRAGVQGLVTNMTKSVDGFPEQLSTKVVEIPMVKNALNIDLEKKVLEMDQFSKDADTLCTKIDKANLAIKAKWDSTPAMAPIVRTILRNLNVVKMPLKSIKSQLDATGDKSMKNTLLKADKDRQKATSKTEIENKIRKQTRDVSEKMKNITEDLDKEIEEAFNTDRVTNYTEKIKSHIDKTKKNLNYLWLIMLCLLPVYLVLASSICSCIQSTKFLLQKKAEPREEIDLIIPLAIGCALAFLPLLTSTYFMSVSGVVNVVCNAVFKDESFGFVPQALSALDQEPFFLVGETKVEFQSVIQECKHQKTLLAALNGETFLDENMIAKKFNISATKNEVSGQLGAIPLHLPATNSWNKIENTIKTMKGNQKNADDNFYMFRSMGVPKVTNNVLSETEFVGKIENVIPEVKDLFISFDAFKDKVYQFEVDNLRDITIAKQLTEDALRAEMANIMVGEGAMPSGLLLEIFNTIDAEYKQFRTELVSWSTNCDFVFATFKAVGEVVCDQTLGGLNGIYAAIGLGVFSFFSAACGTVMIWHSLWAGKEKKDKSSDEGNKTRTGEGEGGEEGIEEESCLPPDEEDTVKIGEEAESKTKSLPSASPIEPTSPVGQPVPYPLLPMDPVAPGEKTNPSLIPNDAPVAGTPVSPNSIKIVNMETSNNQDDKHNSITGTRDGRSGRVKSAQSKITIQSKSMESPSLLHTN